MPCVIGHGLCIKSSVVINDQEDSMKNSVHMPRRLSKLIAGVALASCGFTTQAAVYDFVDSGLLYATLTTSGGTDFSLNFLAAPSPSTAFIFNLELAITGADPCGGAFTAFSTATQSSGSMTGTCDPSGFTDASKTFNWEILFPTSNSPGTDRMEVGDIANFSISPSDISAWSISQLHVNAYNALGQSIKLTGCVEGTDGCTPPPPPPPNCTPGVDCTLLPEPGVLSLLGVSLLGLAGMRRRKST